MEQLRVITEGIGIKGRMDMPLGRRLTVARGKEREVLAASYKFSHLSSVDALDDLWGSINQYEYSLKSMLIESVFNGDWQMEMEEKRSVAAEIRDGSLDSAITNWSHLLDPGEAAKANRFLTSDLLKVGTKRFEDGDPRISPSRQVALIAEDMLRSVKRNEKVSVKVGPYGDPADENSWSELTYDGKDAEGRISLCPAFLYFGKDSLCDTTHTSGDAFVRPEARNMMYQPKRNGEVPEGIPASLEGAEEALRAAENAMRGMVKGRIDFDAQHGKFRYYNRKGRRGDFLGLPMSEKKFGAILCFMEWFDFLGNEVFMFENAEMGLLRKEKEVLASFIGALTGVKGFRVIVTGDDGDFLDLVKSKAAGFSRAEDTAEFVIGENAEILLDGEKLETPSGEEGKPAAEAAAETAPSEMPKAFYEMSTGIDMEPYFTDSFNGAAYYLNRMMGIIASKPCMEEESVRNGLNNAFIYMSLIMHGQQAETSFWENWDGFEPAAFAEHWKLSDVKADIRDRRSNRYMEITGIGDGFGFTPDKEKNWDFRPWLLEKMEGLLTAVWTLARTLEENGVRFNANTMAYKSLDAFLYYMSDAWYITERAKVHRHIMKDVKDKIEYLYTYYGLKKVVKKASAV